MRHAIAGGLLVLVLCAVIAMGALAAAVALATPERPSPQDPAIPLKPPTENNPS
jgi:hypothetical protein